MPSTRLSTTIALMAALAAASSAVGCATPTLPLPPPAAITASPPDAEGIVTVTGEVLPEAYVYCLNLDTDRGIIERADMDGVFTIRIEASAGDYLSLFQEAGTDRGPPLEVRVPAP